jgi:aspartate 4-decarboxylase
MDLAEPKSNNLTRYYALVDLKRMAQKRHGQAFSDYLEKKWPLEFLIRLAQNHSTVCLPGEGFAGPKWSLRVALANVKSEDCAKVGENIVSVMDSYYKEWQKKG